MQLGRDAWIGAALAMVAVAAGAFGAHAAGDGRAAGLIETAARYQMWHALAIILTAIALPAARLPVLFFAVGILAFSGSLYALALGAPVAVTALAPVGGLAFIAGWALLALAFWRSRLAAR